MNSSLNELCKSGGGNPTERRSTQQQLRKCFLYGGSRLTFSKESKIMFFSSSTFSFCECVQSVHLVSVANQCKIYFNLKCGRGCLLRVDSSACLRAAFRVAKYAGGTRGGRRIVIRHFWPVVHLLSILPCGCLTPLSVCICFLALNWA